MGEAEENTDEKALRERFLPKLFDKRKHLNKEGKGILNKYGHLAGKVSKKVTHSRQSNFKRSNHFALDDEMPDQSLCSAHNEDDGSDLEPDESLDRILEQDSVNFEGKIYNRNTFYYMEGDERRAFGIKEFLRDGDSDSCSSAFCIEIVPFGRTVLETVNSTKILEFIQRGGSEKEVHLSDLEEEVGKIPEFLYHERQEEGSSKMFFGLLDDSMKPQRNGFRNLKESPLRGIDLFAGAGLMSNGFQAASFDVVVSVEKDEDATRSYAKAKQAYMSTVSGMTADVCKQILANKGKIAFHDTVEAFLKKCATDPSFKEALGPIDFVIACSPCQGFSKQNIFKGGNVEGNNYESLRILEVAKFLHPKVIVFENVLGMWESNHIKGYLQKMVYGLTFEFGYNVKVGKIIAADFGDPQLRPRLFLIASLSDIGLPVFPKPTHGQPGLCNIVPGGLVPYATAKDALITEENKYPEKENPINDDGKTRDPNRPTTTVLASKSAAHYNVNLNRYYSQQENAILMGQSPDFLSNLVGNDKSKQRQIGNGVSMGTARAIAQSCMEVLKWNWKRIEKPQESPTAKKSGEESKPDVEGLHGSPSRTMKSHEGISCLYQMSSTDVEGTQELPSIKESNEGRSCSYQMPNTNVEGSHKSPIKESNKGVSPSSTDLEDEAGLSDATDYEAEEVFAF